MSQCCHTPGSNCGNPLCRFHARREQKITPPEKDEIAPVGWASAAADSLAGGILTIFSAPMTVVLILILLLIAILS